MTASPSPPRTVRVRIAVAVDNLGNWVARGSTTSGNYAKIQARDILKSEHYFWIEADVPVPVREVAQTIEGRVCGE